MKKLKQIIVALLLVVTFWFGASPVLAANLAVTSIGVESTTGETLDNYGYTGENPTIVGTASPEAEVDIKIDDLSTTVVADESGDWSYTPTTLTVGEYAVEITSNLETISFTLTISSETTTSESTSSAKGGATDSSEVVLPDELPQSGTGETLVLLIAGGLFFIGLSAVLHSQKIEWVESVDDSSQE